MSCGVPAVAPNHTAMRDYVFEDSAFIFKTNAELTQWQHDPRRSYRCVHFRPDWAELVAAYRKSYETAKTDPDAYRAMGENAIRHLKDHCSIERTTQDLRTFLDQYMHLFDHSGGVSKPAPEKLSEAL